MLEKIRQSITEQEGRDAMQAPEVFPPGPTADAPKGEPSSKGRATLHGRRIAAKEDTMKADAAKAQAELDKSWEAGQAQTQSALSKWKSSVAGLTFNTEVGAFLPTSQNSSFDTSKWNVLANSITTLQDFLVLENLQGVLLYTAMRDYVVPAIELVESLCSKETLEEFDKKDIEFLLTHLGLLEKKVAETKKEREATPENELLDAILGEQLVVTDINLAKEPGGETIKVKINGKPYKFTAKEGFQGGIKELHRKFQKMVGFSPGRGLSWLKNNAVLVAGGKGQGGVEPIPEK